MIDMRDEDDAALQPHSQLRHERMHNQYNRMREEDNHWQDVSVCGYSPHTSSLRFILHVDSV